MNWGDERYVRVYTRDTADWLSLSFIAQGLFCLILRKVDRAGIMPLGRHGRRAVAITVGFAGEWSRLEPALDELLTDGCVVIRGDTLVVPNFIEAQEAAATEAARQRAHREAARDLARAKALGLAPESRNVTDESRSVTFGHETGQNVTNGHEVSQVVTPCRAVPSRTVPTEEKQATISRLPSKADLLASKYPATARLASEGGFSFPSKPETRDAVEAAILAVGHDAALAAARASFAANGKTHLGWHLDAIRAGKATPTEVEPSADMGWLNALPEPRRSEAAAAWDRAVRDVRTQFKPDAHPRALASAAEMLRMEFAS